MADLSWTVEYVGVPYKLHGRTKSGADCWGLVRLALVERFGKDVPSFTDEYFRLDEAADAIVRNRKDMVIAVEKPEVGDLVLMRIRNAPCHVGLWVGDGYVLHADPAGEQGSRMEQLTRALKLRVEGYYHVR